MANTNIELHRIISVREYKLEYANISSLAYSNVLVDNVSKLNGRRINVTGSSLIISIVTKVKADKIANLLSGNVTREKSLNELSPNDLPKASYSKG